MSDEHLKQGREYVEKQRQAGKTDDEIRQGLLEAGWAEEQVDGLFAEETPQPAAATWGAPETSEEPAAPSVPRERTIGASPADLRQMREAREPVVERPSALTLLVVLVDIGAILGILAGIMFLLAAGAMAGMAGASGVEGMPVASIGALVVVLGIFLIGLYAGILVVSHFLWKGFNWARITMIALMGLSGLLQIQNLLTQSGRLVPALWIVLCVLFIIVLVGEQAKAYCTR